MSIRECRRRSWTTSAAIPRHRWRKSNGLASYRIRQTWAFVVGKFMIDPIWWFYLFWVPDFLQRKHGLSLMKIGVAHHGHLCDR